MNLNVAADYRRRGIAQKLILAACGRYAGTQAGKMVILDVRKDNTAAMELYKKLGFTISGLPSKNGDSDVIMTIPLDALPYPQTLPKLYAEAETFLKQNRP